ncbi:Uncharacterised protein [Mycobacteroides abscessus subsp. abscessus]|nr:Uncharacterised protein [Mycobacteroides abscessus subsp. abscessus]
MTVPSGAMWMLDSGPGRSGRPLRIDCADSRELPVWCHMRPRMSLKSPCPAFCQPGSVLSRSPSAGRRTSSSQIGSPVHAMLLPPGGVGSSSDRARRSTSQASAHFCA